MSAEHAARKAIARLGAALGADLSARLWTGEIVPLIPGARDDLVVVIAGPDVVKRILLAPGAETAFRLMAEGRLRVQGGSPLEALDRIDHGRLVHLRKALDRKALAREAWPLLFVPSRPRESAPSADPETGRGRDRAGRADADFIRFHYDVGNDFYALFLDPEHVYSSAAFSSEADDLDAAQIRKLDRICRKLDLKPGDRLLDIGCGWGALAIHAATRFGASVHGVTLSPAQLSFARNRVEALGLSDRITLELRDYRDLMGTWDAVSQIEMFEHLGFRNHDLHFQTVHRLLKPGGLYLHQASVRRGGVRPGPPGRPARAITRFIFPGGGTGHPGHDRRRPGPPPVRGAGRRDPAPVVRAHPARVVGASARPEGRGRSLGRTGPHPALAGLFRPVRPRLRARRGQRAPDLGPAAQARPPRFDLPLTCRKFLSASRALQSNTI
jgi:Cyclopropane fatty acid synthase and related methyltransferases